jgi:hypothetical protein
VSGEEEVDDNPNRVFRSGIRIVCNSESLLEWKWKGTGTSPGLSVRGTSSELEAEMSNASFLYLESYAAHSLSWSRISQSSYITKAADLLFSALHFDRCGGLVELIELPLLLLVQLLFLLLLFRTIRIFPEEVAHETMQVKVQVEENGTYKELVAGFDSFRLFRCFLH